MSNVACVAMAEQDGASRLWVAYVPAVQQRAVGRRELHVLEWQSLRMPHSLGIGRGIEDHRVFEEHKRHDDQDVWDRHVACNSPRPADRTARETRRPRAGRLSGAGSRTVGLVGSTNGLSIEVC